MATVLLKSKINNTMVKLIQLKTGFKVSYSSFYREFSTIEKAAKHYVETIKSFADNDARNIVTDFNHSKALKDL